MNVENRFVTEDIVRATSGMLINGDMGIPFRGISTDTRIIKPGYLFWALKGERFDGHDFWKEAINKGAKGLVLSKLPQGLKPEELPKTISVIFVRDTLRALGDFASFWRKKLNFHAVEVAGSCGKTTTKEMVFALVSKFFKAEKSPGNYNNLIGVPLSILSFKEGTEVGVLELGTNTPGEVKRLAEIVYPQTSIITCIAPEHLEGLGDIKGVLKEEISLFEATDPSGTLIYNFDDPLLKEEVKRFSQRKFSVGFDEGADLRLSCKKGENGIQLELFFRDKTWTLSFPDLGMHNLLNFGFALSTCLSLGIEMEPLLEVADSLKKELFIRAKVHRLSSFIVVDDTYNANPSSMEAALSWVYSSLLEGKRELVVILGDMKELGEASSELHQKVGKEAAKLASSAIFVGEFAEEYAQGFKESGKPCKCYHDVEELICALDSITFPKGSVILVKGSRALAMERIVKKLLERG